MKNEFTLGATPLKYSFFPKVVDGNELRYMDGFDDAFTARHLWHYVVNSFFTEGAYCLSLNPGHLNEFSFHVHVAKNMKDIPVAKYEKNTQTEKQKDKF